MSTASLAVFGLMRKPHVASPIFGQLSPMRESLQELVVRRLGEEMAERRLSANGLARLCGVGQTSISRILAGKQDPGLEKLEELSVGLGIPAWYLLVEKNTAQAKIIRPPSTKVVPLPSPYPRVFAASQTVKKYRVKGGKSR